MRETTNEPRGRGRGSRRETKRRDRSREGTARSRVRRRRQEPISRASSIQAVIGPSKRRVFLAERTLPGSRGASPLLCWCGYERECFSVLLLAIRKEPSFFGGFELVRGEGNMPGVVVVFVFVFVVLLLLLVLLWARSARTAHDLLVSTPRTLLVTAHPDDECMFFAPTVLELLRRRCSLFMLCLSTGNYRNEAEVRKKELLRSCHVLGVSPSNVTIIDHRELPDNPTISWNVQLVTDLILRHVKEHRIDLMLSFDQWGVSGHANHVAIYQAFRYIYVHKLTPPGCRMLCLHSVTLLRKYSSLLELPLALLQPHVLLCLARCSQYRQALRAMMCHRSQMLWFRWLYLLFSRYMFVNTFWDVSKIELELCGAIPDSR